MSTARISGKKLVIVGSLVLIVVAASVRIFAGFYLRDQTPIPQTQPAPDAPAATQP